VATPERVVIAAAGVVTPIGQDLEAFWSSLVTGASGISQIERVPVADLRVQRGGEVKKLGRIKDWRGVPDCRASRLLIAAADDLCAQAGFRPLPLDPARVGVVVGTALGGVEEGERALAGDRGRRRLPEALYDGPGWSLAPIREELHAIRPKDFTRRFKPPRSWLLPPIAFLPSVKKPFSQDYTSRSAAIFTQQRHDLPRCIAAIPSS